MKKRLLAILLLVALVPIGMVFVVAVYPMGGGENLSTLFFGGTVNDELGRVKSPDSRSVAVLFHKYEHGPGQPPEPPKTLERWARLKVLRDGRTVYDSGYENLNPGQMSPGHALDVVWSPDSRRLAYRFIGSFRIIDLDGKATTYPVGSKDSVISSFQWRDNESLLIVSKRTEYPPGRSGTPENYTGYTGKVKGIRIARLDLTKGKTERYEQALNKPTFVFHAIDFCTDEISPKADRVAFSDGTDLCIYDDAAGKILSQIKIPQAPLPTLPPRPPRGHATGEQLHAYTLLKMAATPTQLDGVWWQTNGVVVAGVGLLSSPRDRYAFYTYDVTPKTLTDKSSVLVPLWLGSNKTRDFREPDWFRSALK